MDTIAQQVAEGIRVGVQEAIQVALQAIAVQNTVPAPEAPVLTAPPGNILNSSIIVPDHDEEVNASQLVIPILEEPTTHVSFSKPLHSSVALKHKQKIWAGEFIDFNILIDKDERHMRLGMFDNGDDETPRLVWKQSKQRQLSIAEWTDAFHVFMAIVIEKDPGQAPNMLRYHNLIRSVATEGGDWQYYDENFRRSKEAEGLAWAHVDHVTLNFAMFRGSSKSKPAHASQPFLGKSSTKGKREASIPRGYCYKYHKGLSCTGPCRYKHVCFKCPAAHPILRCPKKQSFESTSTSTKYPNRN